MKEIHSGGADGSDNLFDKFDKDKLKKLLNLGLGG